MKLNTYANVTYMQIYVVDSLDRERIGKAKAEFQVGVLDNVFKLTSWLG